MIIGARAKQEPSMIAGPRNRASLVCGFCHGKDSFSWAVEGKIFFLVCSNCGAMTPLAFLEDIEEMAKDNGND